MNMKKIAQYILYVWTALILIMSCLFFYFGLFSGGFVSNEFKLLVAILRVLILIAVWLALFGFWFTLPEKKSEPASQPDKWTS